MTEQRRDHAHDEHGDGDGGREGDRDHHFASEAGDGDVDADALFLMRDEDDGGDVGAFGGREFDAAGGADVDADVDAEVFADAPDEGAAEHADGAMLLQRRLEQARHELLDLSARNRLISTPRTRSRSTSVEIVDERSAQVFDMLVRAGRKMSFRARDDEDDNNGERAESGNEQPPAEAAPAASAEPIALEPAEAPEPAAPEFRGDDVGDLDLEAMLVDQPNEEHEQDDPDLEVGLIAEEDDLDEHGVPERHRDNKLQTDLNAAVLQRRLLRMYYDARTYQEEQGVNILFLALGFLQWYESPDADKPRYAPLLLVPVELMRASANQPFRVQWTGEDITTNLSLHYKLKAEFGIDLPTIDDAEEFTPEQYLDAVEQAVAAMPRWSVQRDDMVLWFFAFAKLLMFRDLDPSNWPQDNPLLTRALLTALLGEGFISEASPFDENILVDDVLDARRTAHIVDADSSQALAIEEVRQGRNLIIQGPPGTGKSQTIANIIGAAVLEGQRVLFVAEKAAALNVVKRRMEAIGLGDTCLELHSNRTSKRALVEELGRTLALERPLLGPIDQTADDLQRRRDALNLHCGLMHTPHEPSQRTPYAVLGELVRLRQLGVAPVDFPLDDAAQWSPAELRERTGALTELAQHTGQIGRPAAHPWRGVQLETMLPMDRRRLADTLPDAAAQLTSALESAGALAPRVHATAPRTLADMRLIVHIARHLAACPHSDAIALGDDVWDAHHADLAHLVAAGAQYAEQRETLADTIAEAGWDADVSEARRDMAAYGRSLWRIFNPRYRRACAVLRGMLKQPPPRALDERIALLDAVIDTGRQLDVITTAESLGQRAFGTLWRRAASDWLRLAAIMQWIDDGRADEHIADDLRCHAPVTDAARQELARSADALEQAIAAAEAQVQRLCAALELDLTVAFDAPAPDALTAVPLADARQRIEAWAARMDDMADWIAWRHRAERCRALDLAPLVDRMYDGRIDHEAAVNALSMAIHEALLRAIYAQRPPLAQFEGLSHERMIERFRATDLQRITLARQEVAAAHYQQIPRGAADIGEVGVIRRELNKRRRHMPIRQLLARAGDAITRIKPVFMMSPLSIAQYVEPGALQFDLLVIDEASQVRPVDALGAAARCRQMVVVGDDRQLPPTRFFSTTIDEAIDDEHTDMYDARAGDLESVLGLCRAQNVPDRMLRWHYRSRHHSLIAVSNREFYDSRLYVIPSPEPRGDGMGLMFHHVTDGVYDRGGSASNRIEAQRVAEAVMQHARAHPEQTLGVAAFSIRQRDAILDELERVRRQTPELESFFANTEHEPFFVKNLENVQGDERDVIMISVGFGPDADGYMTMNFGPVSTEGGERRLNVLITRARARCEVFSTITHEDIDLARATGRGPAALKTFLAYARTGQLGAPRATGNDPDSQFERCVARALQQHGYAIEPQVGDAGFYIDIAVRDPDHPSRYLLGIECDGASYHSSRSARDRDRIREAVLEARGWIIHRIWSSDWFNHPEAQLTRAIAAIEGARAQRGAARAASSAAGARTDAGSDDAIERRSDASEHGSDDNDAAGAQEAERITASYAFVEPYREASFRVPHDIELHELSVAKFDKVLLRIVEQEGPIHRDEIAQRVTTLWGMVRTGSRITRTVEAGLDRLLARAVLVSEDAFITSAEHTYDKVRYRGDVASGSLRRLDMLPPCEIQYCVQMLVAEHLGVTRDEAIVTTARLLGFRLTSAPMRELISGCIDALIASSVLAEDEHTRLTLLSTSTSAADDGETPRAE